MTSELHAVVETAGFLNDARRAGISDDERQAIVNWIAAQPDAGDVIPGTGGARKLRFAGQGKGKSGAYRVITFYSGVDIPVFLLNVFSKGERVDLSQADRNAMKSELAGLVADYRKGVRRVKGR